MSKHYYHRKTIEIPLYLGDFLIILTNDVKKLNKKFNIHEKHIYGAAITHLDDRVGLVLNFDLENCEMTHGVIAHEAAHVVNKIFMDRKIILDPDNDEPYCYLTSWVVNQTYKFIKEKGFYGKII